MEAVLLVCWITSRCGAFIRHGSAIWRHITEARQLLLKFRAKDSRAEGSVDNPVLVSSGSAATRL